MFTFELFFPLPPSPLLPNHKTEH